MKLIETPVQSNIDINYFYPKITEFIFGQEAIKFFKIYSLDRTQVIYADAFDSVIVILVNEKKKVTKQEVDYVLRHVLHLERDEVEIHLEVKQAMQKAGYEFSRPKKDVIVIKAKTTDKQNA